MSRFVFLGPRSALPTIRTLEGYSGAIYMNEMDSDLNTSIALVPPGVEKILIQDAPVFIRFAALNMNLLYMFDLNLIKVASDGTSTEPQPLSPRTLLARHTGESPSAGQDAAAGYSAAAQLMIQNAVQRGIEQFLSSEKFESVMQRILRKSRHASTRDINYLVRLQAGLASADFTLANIPLHLIKQPEQLRKDAVLSAPDGGLFLEFGVFKGRWIRFLAAQRDVHFYGFDSFVGLPEPWAMVKAGNFDMGGVMPEMPSNVTLIKGWFEETLEGFLAEHPDEPISYIDMDCDIYSATAYVLETVKARLRVGTVILLDDFMIEPGWEKEEHKAFMDFVDKYGITFRYTGYRSMSVSVVLEDLGTLQ